MNAQRLKSIVERFNEARIAVVGDLMLDVYIWGKAERISPEAPVPVIQVKKKSCCLGGAANVMRNVTTMGGRVIPFGVIGDDEDGTTVESLFGDYGIATDTLSIESARRTTKKQRVIASSQQLLRIDFEDTTEVVEETRDAIVGKVVGLIEQGMIDAVIFEDYGKGVLNEAMLERIVAAAAPRGVVTALDPKPGHLAPVKNLSVIKPNRAEAYAMTGAFCRTNGNIPIQQNQELKAVAAKLLDEWEPRYLLISLSGEGMALFAKDSEPVVIPTRAREVFDVSGAGDTVIAAFTLALTVGASPEAAAEIANHAAGIVVGHVGTATVSADELTKCF